MYASHSIPSRPQRPSMTNTESQFREAFRTNEFYVEVDGIPNPGVVKVSGLSDGSVEALDQPQGGSNIVRKVPASIVKFEDLTIERYMTGDQGDAEFKEWFQQSFPTLMMQTIVLAVDRMYRVKV